MRCVLLSVVQPLVKDRLWFKYLLVNCRMIQKQQVSIASTISSDVIDTCSASGDYQRLIMDAIFVSGTPFCGINIQTEADLIYETNELFSVSLSDASASTRVRLGAQKIIRIMDGQSKSEITDSVSGRVFAFISKSKNSAP